MAKSRMETDSPLFLDAYKTIEDAPALRPGGSRREWMDNSPSRHAYRCLPLTMANATGWELTLPHAVELKWNGGPDKSDLKITMPDSPPGAYQYASSHFNHGIVTFHVGYLFRTPPGWAVWCMGPPNWPKDGIYPLSGLVETDWLPFPFTMNWQMTRPGKVRFEKDEPFCFVTLSEHQRMDAVTPKIKYLKSNKVLEKEYKAWSQKRDDFNFRLDNHDPGAARQGWQRHYMKGEHSDGRVAAKDHLTKRRLNAPKDVTGKALFRS